MFPIVSHADGPGWTVTSKLDGLESEGAEQGCEGASRKVSGPAACPETSTNESIGA
jgi:hypothetical protein